MFFEAVLDAIRVLCFCFPSTGDVQTSLRRKRWSGRSHDLLAWVLALVWGNCYLSRLNWRCLTLLPSYKVSDRNCLLRKGIQNISVWKVLHEILPLTITGCHTNSDYKWRILEGEKSFQLVYFVHIWQPSVYSQLHDFLG